jgi:1,4-dihydroxy-2-naphthoate octaprenyltransferase
MSMPPQPGVRDIWIHLLLYPGHTLPTAAAPVLVGIGLAIRDGLFAPWPVLIAFLGSWLIHVGGVFTDNYELLRRHPRLPEHPELVEAVARGTLRLPQLRFAIYACFGLAALCLPYLYAIGGAPVLLFGAIGILASVGYAGGPVPYVRYGLAEPFFFIMFGVVAEWGSYYIQAAGQQASFAAWPLAALDLPGDLFLLGLPVGALVTAVLIIDDIRDRGFDSQKDWRTATVRYGLHCARIRFALLQIFAGLFPLFLWSVLDYAVWILLPLATLPMAYSILQNVFRYEQTPDLLPMSPAASRLALVYAALLATGNAMPVAAAGI